MQNAFIDIVEITKHKERDDNFRPPEQDSVGLIPIDGDCDHHDTERKLDHMA